MDSRLDSKSGSWHSKGELVLDPCHSRDSINENTLTVAQQVLAVPWQRDAHDVKVFGVQRRQHGDLVKAARQLKVSGNSSRPEFDDGNLAAIAYPLFMKAPVWHSSSSDLSHSGTETTVWVIMDVDGLGWWSKMPVIVQLVGMCQLVYDRDPKIARLYLD